MEKNKTKPTRDPEDIFEYLIGDELIGWRDYWKKNGIIPGPPYKYSTQYMNDPERNKK